MLSICKKIAFAAVLVVGLGVGTASAASFCGTSCPPPVRYAPVVNNCAPVAPAPGMIPCGPVACAPAMPAPVVASCDPCGNSGFQSSSVAGYSGNRYSGAYSGVTYEDSNSNAIYLIPTTGGLMETQGYRPPTNEVDSYYSSRYQQHWY